MRQFTIAYQLSGSNAWRLFGVITNTYQGAVKQFKSSIKNVSNYEQAV